MQNKISQVNKFSSKKSNADELRMVSLRKKNGKFYKDLASLKTFLIYWITSKDVNSENYRLSQRSFFPRLQSSKKSFILAKYREKKGS